MSVSVAGEIVESYNTFVAKVEELRIPDALNVKPLLDVRVILSYSKTITDAA